MALNRNEIDPRLMTIDVIVNNKTLSFSQPLYIKAVGMKYANQNQNEAEIVIANLKKETANFLLTQTSPFNPNKTPKTVVVKAGRKSYGLTTVFIGNITSSAISQPPDVFLTLRCLTQNTAKGDVVSIFKPPESTVKSIAKDLADSLKLSFNFQAQDKSVSNYSFTGGKLNQIQDVQSLGAYDVFVDDDTLVVKDQAVPLTGKTYALDIDNGLIGKPEFTEQGVQVKYMFNGTSTLGGSLKLISKTNPATNGTYVIYKLGFELTTRDDPFYLVAEALRVGQ